LAPGLPGAAAATEQLRAAGVAVSLGHGEGEGGITECVDAGARLATHLFNAMGPTHHRDPGMAGHILDEERMLCSMILDGVHVHETAVRNAYRQLGNHRLVLVSDSTAAAGMPDGDYRFAGTQITRRDGAVRNAKGNLTGSCLTMAEAAQNFLRMIPEAGAYSLGRVGAANPAAVLGDDRRGVIHPGHAAEFCVLRPDGTVTAL
jgi:N-acetylglucosamine-6-phosphate deacetylase